MNTFVRSALCCALVTAGLATFLSACANMNERSHRSTSQPRTVTRHQEPAAAYQLVTPSNLSPQLSEIVTLSQSGMSESVMLSYVEKSPGPYYTTADDLVVLRDAGVPQPVIAAIVSHPSAKPVYVQQTQPAAPVAVEVIETNQPVATNTAVIVTTNPPQPTTVVVQQPATTTVVTQPPVVVQAPQMVQFRESLDPFGRWIDVSGYGLCWQPTVAVRDRGWRPYHSAGRWIYTNHGWYWMSDYSWGWAAFHYGRWNNSRYGWVWVPGYDWGPAWVSWRRGHDYIGWAPLPPHAHYDRRAGFRFRGSRVSVRFEWGLGYDDYTFCRPTHFYHRTPYRHYLARSRNVNIYNQTTVVNNYNTAGGNATPSNTSISVQTVQNASGTEVRRVQVLSNNSGTRTSIRPDRLVSNGDSLAVYRPPNPSNETRQNVRSTRQASPVNRVAQPQGRGGTRSITPAPAVRRSSTTVSTAAPRRDIRPARKVESRTIFVETVPSVRRPTTRPTSSSSTSRAPKPSVPTRSVISTPAPPTTSSNIGSTPTQSTRQVTPSRSPSRTVSTPSSKRITVRTTPTTVPSRTPTVSRSVASPPPTTAPSRTVIRTTPARTVAAPTVVKRPTARPTARPTTPAARPTSRPTPVAPPPVKRTTSSPSRQPASTSSSKSSSENGGSGRPNARPSARPGGN